MYERKKMMLEILGGQYGMLYRMYCYFFHKERRYLWNEYFYNMHARKNGKTFVILRAPYSNTGLMSDIGYFMCLISFWNAKKNYIPVIDMKNYKSPYLKDEEVGKIDAWAFWFKPVSGISADEAYANRKVVLSGHLYRQIRKEQESFADIVNYKPNTVKKWAAIYKKYFHLNNEMKQKLIQERKKIFADNKKKVLGVKFRSTDYLYCLPLDHSIQASCEEMADYTEKIMKKDGYDKVYLSVENPSVVEKFREKFRKKLLIYDCKLADCADNKITCMSEAAVKSVGERQSGEDYLIQILLLSLCDGLLCCENSGVNVAIAMNGGKYEKVYHVNKGINDTGKILRMI